MVKVFITFGIACLLSSCSKNKSEFITDKDPFLDQSIECSEPNSNLILQYIDSFASEHHLQFYSNIFPSSTLSFSASAVNSQVNFVVVRSDEFNLNINVMAYSRRAPKRSEIDKADELMTEILRICR